MPCGRSAPASGPRRPVVPTRSGPASTTCRPNCAPCSTRASTHGCAARWRRGTSLRPGSASRPACAGCSTASRPRSNARGGLEADRIGAMSANLAANLVNTAAEHGDRPAVKQGDAVLTYRQLDGATTHIAGMLKAKGVEPGDRVGIMLPNVAYVPVIYYGILRAGAVIVPMNPLLKGREVAFHLRDSGARVMFAWADMAEAAQAGAEEVGADAILVAPGEFEQEVGAAEPDTDVADRAADDTAVILYTSGTTGQPKGAELTHGNMRRNAQASLELHGYGPEGVLLGALPLFHSFGQTCCMNAAIRGGACLVLLARFDPGDALRIIQDEGVTVFAGVPTMYTAMLNHPERDAFDTSGLEVCVSGGSAMPGEVLRGFEEAFGAKVLEGYGLSETSP